MLTMACCDPAAGLMAAEYARVAGFRLLVFPRSGSAALELLRQRLVHVAGLHRSTAEHPDRNVETVRTETLDLCFPAEVQRDRRIQALIRVLRSRAYRRLVSELPGYDGRYTGDMATV